jgi:hypothetical protein
MDCHYCGKRPVVDGSDFCSDECASYDELDCQISQDAFLRGMQDMVHMGNLAELRDED